MTKPSKHARPVNGKALFEARAALGLTQAQMAARIHVTDDDPYMDDSRLSKIELGKAPWPSVRMREALTRAYGITDAQLTAPCETCGGDWTAACMDHPAGGERAEPAGAKVA